MIKAIFFDVGGVLFLNNNGKGYLNTKITDFIENNNSYQYGLLSSTDLDLEPTLKEFNLKSYFSLVQTTGQIGIEKDSPEFFIHAAKVLDISPDEIIMIDNDEEFIVAARQVGLHTIQYAVDTDIERQISEIIESITNTT